MSPLLDSTYRAPAAAGDARLGEILSGQPPARPACTIGRAAGAAEYHALRRAVFVDEQGLFAGHDHDERDDDPRLVVLAAHAHDGEYLGGVRLGPMTEPDVGWWFGGRLVVTPAGRTLHGVGAALVRAACAHAEAVGALRFDAEVQPANEVFFRRLGWHRVRDVTAAGRPHVLMRWPIGRLWAAASSKAPLGRLLAGLQQTPFGLGGGGFVGDDGAPVPGSDLVAACDAIVPSMVERDPGWAGWCSVLVNVNDLAAMGAEPVGLLDAVAGPDPGAVARVLAGLRAAAVAYGVPVLGGHTQLGVPAALAVTALGRTAHPVPGGGGRPGQRVRLTADLAGSWRPGYGGRQWDSTSTRRTPELRAMLASVGAARPAAAKDVSMAGVAGTLGMLAEASGCGAVLDVAAVPRPAGATVGDWLTCFPGFAMLTAGGRALDAGPAVGAECGDLVAGSGVMLRWPDGELTPALGSAVTGLPPAGCQDGGDDHHARQSGGPAMKEVQS